jgi:hypothetical protein
MHQDSSTARDARLLVIGVLIATISLIAGFALTLWWADTVRAHTCVGEWRTEQWDTAIAEPPHVWEPDEHFAGLNTCAPVVPVPVVSLDLSEPPPTPLTVPPATTVAPSPFTADVERWRPLVATYFPASAVHDALLVMSRESAGCETAAAYHGCVGTYLPRQNTTGCQARGIFQHCGRYWQDRIERYGLAPHCLPPEMIIDPTCNVALAHALWLDSGCSWYPHWEQTDHGTRRGC